MSINFVTVRADLISSLKCGREIKNAVFPSNCDELVKIWQDIGEDAIFLGGLSNTLVASEVNTYVVFSDRLRGIKRHGTIISSGAGERTSSVATFAKKNGLSGMEALSAIPGTIGGAVKGNAGCFDTEISDILYGVEVFKFDTGTVEYYSREELFFSYRYGNFIDGREMLTKVYLALSEDDIDSIEKRTRKYLAKRKATQPSLPSLGSVFRRHEGVSAGYYIEQAGLKGTRIGGMEFSTVHANFIVNVGGTPEDYIDLVILAERKVYDKYGIKLLREVKIIDEEDGKFGSTGGARRYKGKA